MPELEHESTDPFEQATSAAIEDIHAALSATDQTDGPTTEGGPAVPPATAAPGPEVGHGTIRLRGPDPEPGAADVATASNAAGHGSIRLRGRTARGEPAAAEPIGHGTIRLHDPTAPREAVADDAVGHGTIRLHGRAAPPEPGLLRAIAVPIQPEDPITMAAAADILAAIAATA